MNVNDIQYPMFDYDKQVWILRGKYLRCGHPETMRCGCYGREHCGEAIDQASEANIRKQLVEEVQQ